MTYVCSGNLIFPLQPCSKRILEFLISFFFATLNIVAFIVATFTKFERLFQFLEKELKKLRSQYAVKSQLTLAEWS